MGTTGVDGSHFGGYEASTRVEHVCDTREPDPTADVPTDVLDAVADLMDRETVALARLDAAKPRPEAADAVTYSLAEHRPDHWSEWTCYTDPLGYRAFVEALEVVVDTVVVVADAARNERWRRLAGGA